MKPGQNSNQSATPYSIVTESEKLWIDEHGLLQSNVFSVHITRTHALAAIEAMKQLTKGEKAPILVDMRDALSTTNEARKCYGNEGYAVISACAMLIDSPLSKILSNFYLGINKPRYPFRVFTNKQKAIEWLKQYL